MLSALILFFQLWIFYCCLHTQIEIVSTFIGWDSLTSKENYSYVIC